MAKSSSAGGGISLVVLVPLFVIWRKIKKHNREMEKRWQELN